MIISKKEYERVLDDSVKTIENNNRLIKENANLKSRIGELLELQYNINKIAMCNDCGAPEQRLNKIRELIHDYQSID